jgi:hypothetical protein
MVLTKVLSVKADRNFSLYLFSSLMKGFLSSDSLYRLLRAIAGVSLDSECCNKRTCTIRTANLRMGKLKGPVWALLRLQRDMMEREFKDNEIGILEEVLKFVYERFAKTPNVEDLLVDEELLTRSRIRVWHVWHGYRRRKHALMFATATQDFQAARARLQNFRFIYSDCRL